MEFINYITLFVFIYILCLVINNVFEYIDAVHEMEKLEFKKELTSIIKDVVINALKKDVEYIDQK